MKSADEQAIREVVAAWMMATAAGDVSQLRPLMAEDVVFLTPGQAPMRGRDAFVAGFQAALQHVRIQPSGEVLEITVTGDWAYSVAHLSVTVTPRDGGAAVRRRGHTLTVFRKEDDGRWVIARDANMLTVEIASNSPS